MKHFTFFLVAVATMAGLVALIAPATGHASGESAPAFVTEIPHGYRDWKWVSSAHEAGNLNSIGAVLGNEVAFKAYRDGKLPFPDGTIIAALHYRYVPSDHPVSHIDPVIELQRLTRFDNCKFVHFCAKERERLMRAPESI